MPPTVYIRVTSAGEKEGEGGGVEEQQVTEPLTRKAPDPSTLWPVPWYAQIVRTHSGHSIDTQWTLSGHSVDTQWTL